MQQKKSYNFGFRGWLLILWVATGMFSYVVAGNYPLNIMSNAPALSFPAKLETGKNCPSS